MVYATCIYRSGTAFAQIWVMKNLLILLSLASLSCQNLEGYFKNTKDHEARVAEGEPAVRDQSITPATSYSDLFLDSAAVESYIQRQGFAAADAQQIRNFYNQRNYQFAWFASDGFTEQGRGLWNMYTVSDSTDENDKQKATKKLQARVDSLITIDTLQVTASDSAIMQTEIQLTRHFVHFAKSGKTALSVPVKKSGVMEMAEMVLKNEETKAPKNYVQLKEQLKNYYDRAKNGGWPAVSGTAAQIRKGVSSPMVAQLKKRLHASGELQEPDTTANYTPNLDSAIKTFQRRNGMKPDGRITDTILQVMNVPVEKRISQIMVNMNRMLWAPGQAPHSIEVNIPDFMLHVYENGSKAFDMPVVVGKEGSNTMMFTGDLNQIVFSPYWNIPSSIVKEELLPAMKSNPGYLKSKNMEIVEDGEVPVIRQLPGGENSLGKVKFLFPNSFDIYFHDTPAKSLFAREKRAFSHGCIRLADAQKMAVYLLRDDPDWNEEKIAKAMNSGKEQYVKLKNAVPVRINYYTAWVDESGQLNFRDDIYGHDEKVAGKLFTAMR